MTVGVRFCSSKLGLDSVDVVKENFSTSNSTAREPGLKRVIAESSSPKNHKFFLSSLPHPLLPRGAAASARSCDAVQFN